MRTIRTRVATASIAVLAACFATVAGAQTYPSKPIRIILPFQPGASGEAAARIIGERLNEEWKQPVVMENRPGAGFTIGAGIVARAAPDGYTLLVTATTGHATSGLVYKNLAYDWIRSFAPVALLSVAPFVVVVNATGGIDSLATLFERARVKPNAISYGSSGAGAGPHLATEVMAQTMGVQMLHVPFKGNAPARIALIAGQIDFLLADISAMTAVRAGQLRALAVTTAQRSPLAPDLPTLAEAGVAGLDMPSGQGMLAPAGTPPEVVAKLNQTIVRALGDEEVRRRFATQGLTAAAPMTPDEFRAMLVAEQRKYEKVVGGLNLRLD